MTIYKNISLDNIRKKKNKEQRKENKYFWRCVLVQGENKMVIYVHSKNYVRVSCATTSRVGTETLY